MRRIASIFTAIALMLSLGAGTALAQTALDPSPERLTNQTDDAGNAALQRILERQNAQSPDEAPVADPQTYTAAGNMDQLTAGITDSEAYRAVRLGTDDVTTTAITPAAGVLIQTGGMRWLQLREGPLQTWGMYLLGGVLALLALFFLIRGRVKIAAGWAGRTIVRFNTFERFTHWLMAGSFILLSLTGLFVLFGRNTLIPLMGQEAYVQGAIAAKWIHNNVAWAFMLSLVLAFVMWVWHNIPAKRDIDWFKKGGGLVGKGHPSSKKFNAGQKVIFWTTIILGASVSASGLSLLFPFELPMFAKTFSVIESTGIPGLFGYSLPTELAPHEEMQYANLWHSIVSFVMMAIILAHIYIGSIGMQGAFAAMGSGKVDLNWAREHHDLWVEDKERREAKKAAKKGGPQGAVAPAE